MENLEPRPKGHVMCWLVDAIDASRLTKEPAKIKGVLGVIFKKRLPARGGSSRWGHPVLAHWGPDLLRDLAALGSTLRRMSQSCWGAGLSHTVLSSLLGKLGSHMLGAFLTVFFEISLVYMQFSG